MAVSVFADWLLHMYDLLVGSMHNDALSALMNGPIRKKLGIIPAHVTWGGVVCTLSLSGSLLFVVFLSQFVCVHLLWHISADVSTRLPLCVYCIMNFHRHQGNSYKTSLSASPVVMGLLRERFE